MPGAGIGTAYQAQGYLSYVAGQCTRFVAEHASWIPGYLGDAKDWLDHAKARGLQTSPVPVTGSVLVLGAGQGGALSAGHVALVDSVNQDWTVNVSEMNWSCGPGCADKRQNVTWQDASLGFIVPPGRDATAAQQAYAGGKGPPATPADQGFLGIPGAVSGFGQTIGHLVVGGLLVGIGGLFVLAGLAILALTVAKGAAPVAAQVAAGPAGVAGAVAGAARRKPAAPKPASPARVDSASEAGQAEERAALQAEIAAGNPRPQPGAANRARVARGGKAG